MLTRPLLISFALSHLLPMQQPAPAPAAPLPVVSEVVVVTATVAPATADVVPRGVATLSRADLETIGVSSVIEALRLIPGVDVRARGGRGVQTDFSIRGATFGQSLVLVDGFRLNDSQSAHHNGDIPMPLVGLDRIEVVAGGGSAVHGADALGGTINVIARTDRHASMRAAAGQFGTVESEASYAGAGLPDRWTLTGWANRSGGFMLDREYALGGAVLRGALGGGWMADVRHERRAFGANGFYGNSPSKEWTDQTVAGATWRQASGVWTRDVRAFARHHGDHFRWDINRPGFAENRHTSNAIGVDVVVDRTFGNGRRLSLGGSGGGDWVRSTNLGNHRYTRGSAFGELQAPWGARTAVHAGLRADVYSAVAHDAGAAETPNTGFGVAWSPSISAGTWVTPSLRVRAAASHAFRIPTFTELYYHDPANLGSPSLRPERGWSVDGGLDWRRAGWTMSLSPFVRWDEDVIDWVRAQPTDLWRSTNVRDVTTSGVELSATRRWSGALVRGAYTGLYVDAVGLDLLSKYVKEYAKHSAVISVSGGLGHGLRGAMTLDHRRRLDGQTYTLAAVRIARGFRRVELFAEMTNALNEPYREIAGVPMPGRWAMAGLTVR